MANLEKKDLIIIGAGISGLSAGLAYALNNDMKHKRVLIVEIGPVSGGYVTSFKRSDYCFDTCQMISNIDDVLEYFGVDVSWREFKEDFIRIFKADTRTSNVDTIALPSGTDRFENQMIALFPEEAESLKKFFSYSSEMFNELFDLKYAPGFADMLKMLFTCPKVIRNVSKNFDEYFGRFGFKDPDINLVFQVFSAMSGLPNSRIAALLTVGVMYSLLEKACRPEGLFIDLPLKMEQRYLELGGEILFKSEVISIIVNNKKADGILLKDGSVIYAENIISTVDVKAAMNRLVGIDTVRSLSPKYAKRLEGIEMTTSSFNVNLGLDEGAIPHISKLQCGFAVLTSGDDAYSKLYRAFEKGESVLSEDCFYLGISCPPVQAGRKPILTIQAIPVSISNWKTLRDSDRKSYIREKEKTAGFLIRLVEKYLVPDLNKYIAFMDISSPATFSRYSGSPSGSIFDMASVPENFGRNRLPVKTPIEGLLLPKFAHGVFGSMSGGLQAADVLLGGKVMQGNSRFKKINGRAIPAEAEKIYGQAAAGKKSEEREKQGIIR